MQLTNHQEEMQLKEATTYDGKEQGVQIHTLIPINYPIWEDTSLKVAAK